MTTIRKMHHDDVEAVLPLMRELAIYQGIEYRYQPSPDRLRLQLGIGNPRIYGHLALDGENAVGYCLFYLTDYSSFLSRWQSLHLEDWYVQQPYRGRGIGSELWQRVIESARGQNAERVTLNVHSNNFLAEQFYKRIGAGPITNVDWEMLCVPVG